jgi:small subunit ribosomal protein S6
VRRAPRGSDGRARPSDGAGLRRGAGHGDPLLFPDRMAVAAPTYDLMLIIDPHAEDQARAKIASDTRSAVESGGELARYDQWGERPLAYPIERRTTGEYHLFQFHPGSTALLDELDRTLRITDGVLRFRIIKLKPGVPDPPDMRSAAPRRDQGETPAARPAAPADAAPADAAPSGHAGGEASQPVAEQQTPVAEQQTPVAEQQTPVAEPGAGGAEQGADA